MPIKRVGEGMRRQVDSSGDNAITQYEILEQYQDYFAAKFLLKTGRTHQIRVHISHLGYPLCCDRLYNKNAKPITCPNGKTLNRQALHSCRLEFVHPISGKAMKFVSKAEFL